MDNPHGKHRSRLRARFISDGIASWEKHNITELMLFYVYPRRDTNETAHELCDKYGSLDSLINSEQPRRTALDDFLRLIRHCRSVYNSESGIRPGSITDDTKIYEYILDYFVRNTEIYDSSMSFTLFTLIDSDNLPIIDIPCKTPCILDRSLLTRAFIKYHTQSFFSIYHAEFGGESDNENYISAMSNIRTANDIAYCLGVKNLGAWEYSNQIVTKL